MDNCQGQNLGLGGMALTLAGKKSRAAGSRKQYNVAKEERQKGVTNKDKKRPSLTTSIRSFMIFKGEGSQKKDKSSS